MENEVQAKRVADFRKSGVGMSEEQTAKMFPAPTDEERKAVGAKAPKAAKKTKKDE